MSEDQLSALTEKILACEACHLKDSRTKIVPGIYGPVNGLCFIGEAPGYYEDKQGVPFIGRSGQLLDNMLADIGMKREEDISILNIIKCRPTTDEGKNRTPTESELRFCGERWLYKQLSILSPRLIVTIGGIPLKFFIPSAAVTKYVKKAFDTDLGIKLYVSYHPAYILRNYNLMEEYSEHFKDIKNLYDKLLNEQGIDQPKKQVLGSHSEQKSLTDFFG
ncbi:MAG: uracil-DNA glycosylase [Candidatus Heimdallarchaeota archaeon]|nr:uracil-DNA glycosylase [Candidatus Heimdallarchaeota archaeon]